MTCFSERNPIWGKRNRNICWICWKRYIGRKRREIRISPLGMKASKVAGEGFVICHVGPRWVMGTIQPWIWTMAFHQVKDINCFYVDLASFVACWHTWYSRERELWEWGCYYIEGECNWVLTRVLFYRWVFYEQCGGDCVLNVFFYVYLGKVRSMCINTYFTDS